MWLFVCFGLVSVLSFGCSLFYACDLVAVAFVLILGVVVVYGCAFCLWFLVWICFVTLVWCLSFTVLRFCSAC